MLANDDLHFTLRHMSETSQHIASAIPILETKLYAPRWHADLISRPRLIQRFEQGKKQKLILISAPAGFGKSTLLAEHLASQSGAETEVAWVSLDENDNDPILFWTYFFASLRNSFPDASDQALSLLHSAQAAPIETTLTTLINHISQSSIAVNVHLDDLHLVTNTTIVEALGFLLTHMPENMRLYIATRSDPDLPLSRLRARGKLLELKAADLRFTPEETNAFLQQSMSLNLTADQIKSLETRTEGWIAGLQMAALSMQGRSDVDAFVNAFAGDDRFIIDYLLQEVLQSQSSDVRNFLLQSAILDRLSGPLCDAVTGFKESHLLLQQLERNNLFIIPLDEKRQWYRYHHLFADMLLSRLQNEQPQELADLHIKASRWYEGNDLIEKAIEHALAAEDMQHAAELIEPLWAIMDKRLQSATWMKWALQLPETEVTRRPVINVGIAWAMLDSGELDNIETRLRETEDLLAKMKDPGDPQERRRHGIEMTDKKHYHYLPAHIATARAYRAQAMGDSQSTIRYTRQALDHFNEDDHVEYGSASALLGLAYWSSGEMTAAYQTFSNVLDKFAKTDNVLLAIGPLFVLSDIKAAQGYLIQATNQYRQSLEKIYALEDIVLPGTASLHMGLCAVYCEQGELFAAKKELETCQALPDNARLPSNAYKLLVTKSLLKEASGQADEAIELLYEAERLYFHNPMPNIYSFGGIRTRIWLSLDNLPEALAWVRSENLSPDDDISFLKEYDYVTLSKVFVLRHRHNPRKGFAQKALSILDRMLPAAEKEDRIRSIIDILITRALAYRTMDDVEAALPPLERALELAGPQGYQRMFVSESHAMQTLLRHAVGAGIGGDYARGLLAAFTDGSPAGIADADHELANPLTAREIEILRLIAAGMRNQEIADHLFISLSTVKRHIANAYGKLDAGHRTEAIARAKTLKLL